MKLSHIVIVGGGFVGLLTARLLKVRLSHRAEVTLIDPKDHFLFTPRLIDLLAGQRPSSLRIDIKRFAQTHGFDFMRAQVMEIDRGAREVRYEASSGPSKKISYDVLVLCSGARTSYSDIPGAEQHAFPLKTIPHAERIHAQAKLLLAQARMVKTEKEKRDLLSFVVVGGGATGIEALFALQQYLFEACAGSESDVVPFMSFSLIQAGPQVLPGFKPFIVNGALDELRKAKVQVLIGQPVTQVAEDHLSTSQTPHIPSRLVLWCAGLEANEVEAHPEWQRSPKQFIEVDAYLRADEKTFAGGDMVAYKEKNLGVPKNAQTAFLMAETIVDNIDRTLHHRPLKPFHYVSRGNILLLGKTGILDLNHACLSTRLTPWIRDLFYRYRYWQMTR